MNEYRTCYCNEISLKEVGKKVKIAGFVQTIRDFGGLVFLDIRDMYGITQVVTSGKEEEVDFASHIPLESSVCVYGEVKKRDPETINEVQTPILTSSSPEGARDYLVPSRLHAGKFYALPQAPQQFKQLLMVSGIEKYFQIAPCFRDEDARSDRAPGEFYQLDMEMAYATQEDVFSAIEPVIYKTFQEFSSKKITTYPFPRISYQEAMLTYGTDKPDLRNPLTIIDLSQFFNQCTFKPFLGKTIRAIRIKGHLSKGFHEKLLQYAISLGMPGLGYLEVQEDLSFKGPIDKFIPANLKPELLKLANLQKEDTLFLIADNKKRATELSRTN